ncbi:MAG TPA: hypothetical protein VJ723_05030, partial [Candidatus Angelobacter sp.]|nr:hypothetical protein [Candidatus Angelobacter sp.]
MAKRFLLFSVVAIMAVLAAAPAYAFQARPVPAKLTLVGQPSITIDPLCNPAGVGKGWVKVRNEGASAVPLALAASGLTSKSPAKRLNATSVLTAVAGFGSEVKPDNTASLAANQELWIRVEISGVFEDGDWETTLQNDGVDI